MSKEIANRAKSLVLAPMDGVTDAFMREYLTELMPFTHCVTEFVRVNALPPTRRAFITDIPELNTGCVTKSGVPVHVQILGGDPKPMAEAAQLAASLGAVAIDINFGCPAPTVNRHDGGATLLKFPHRIKEIVSSVRSAVPATIPVSAKLRLGWDDPKAIHLNAEMAEAGGASWITIHGRTKFQGYTPPAYWKPIGEVLRNLSIPVIANGEIWTLDDLKRCEEETGSSHFMIGRGALADPALAGECARYLGIAGPPTGSVETSPPSWDDLLGGVMTRSKAGGESERRTLSRLKQWLNYAHKRGAIDWFHAVKRAESCVDFQNALTVCG
jgi:tRNA-dihydrouridine synthase C